MKISPRIKEIDQMITKHYEHIWDCCCDHGLLGMQLLKRQSANKVHFVDIVKSLTDNLALTLTHYFPDNSGNKNWQVYCQDVAKIPLYATDNTSEKNTQLIIIAGIGGDLLIELVTQIIKNNPLIKLEFLLCPIHHNYKVRQALIQLNLGLLNEKLICDNKRFYEILHVSTDAIRPIASVGSIMWDLSRENDIIYLETTIAHYQRMKNNKENNVNLIISQYQKLMGNH